MYSTLHNSIILSTLSISSYGFVLNYSKMPHPSGESIFFIINTCSFSKLADMRLLSNTSPRTK